MRALVSGAGGFIGGHLTRALLEEGHAVRAADIRPLGEWKQVHDGAQNLDRCDLSVFGRACGAARGCDVIYHLAADSGGMGYISFHHADCMTNILADVNMARAALAEGARIYYASSSCVYPLHVQDDPFTPPLREEDLAANAFNPEQGYGWEKLYAEMTYQAFAADYGLQARIGRYYSVYGPAGVVRGRPGEGADRAVPQGGDREADRRQVDRGVGRRHRPPHVHLRGRRGGRDAGHHRQRMD